MQNSARVVSISTEWRRIQQHVRDTWHPFLDEPHRLAIAWDIGVEPAIEKQRQLVELVHSADGDHVHILCDVVPHLAISPLDALAHNASLAFGALALIDETYVLRAMLPLDDVSIATLDRALRMVSREAARIRHATRVRPAALACFAD